jgi:hypothetical protein
MRRAQSILVIVALLTTPLALLARSVNGEASECTSMCCLRHSHHASLHQGMECQHGTTGHVVECNMTSGHPMDYGLIAPIVPTLPSAMAFIAVPDVSRGILTQFGAVSAAGILSAPFEPPRI